MTSRNLAVDFYWENFRKGILVSLVARASHAGPWNAERLENGIALGRSRADASYCGNLATHLAEICQ
jgi:hypothetical protein